MATPMSYKRMTQLSRGEISYRDLTPAEQAFTDETTVFHQDLIRAVDDAIAILSDMDRREHDLFADGPGTGSIARAIRAVNDLGEEARDILRRESHLTR